MWLICDKPIVSSWEKRSTQQKPPPNPKSLGIFSHAHAGIQIQAVAERKRAISGGILDCLAIWACPQGEPLSCNPLLL